MQALKPINTLVYGVQDLERQLSGRPAIAVVEPAADPVLSRRAREFLFSSLVAVHVEADGGILQLEDSHGNAVDLPLFAAPISDTTREALARGFQSVLTNAGGIADWTSLVSALRAERQTAERHRLESRDASRAASLSGPGNGHAGNTAAAAATGQRILEVFEVERWSPTTGEWTTASLPTDKELSWRWVDATGSRHPHLVEGLPRQKIAAQSRPPCRLDTLFHSTSYWTVDLEGADKDGWQYSVAWNASTWDAAPSILDVLRRRRWTRAYS